MIIFRAPMQRIADGRRWKVWIAQGLCAALIALSPGPEAYAALGRVGAGGARGVRPYGGGAGAGSLGAGPSALASPEAAGRLHRAPRALPSVNPPLANPGAASLRAAPAAVVVREGALAIPAAGIEAFAPADSSRIQAAPAAGARGVSAAPAAVLEGQGRALRSIEQPSQDGALPGRAAVPDALGIGVGGRDGTRERRVFASAAPLSIPGEAPRRKAYDGAGPAGRDGSSFEPGVAVRGAEAAGRKGGLAFGVGRTHSEENNRSTDEAIRDAVAGGRAAAAYRAGAPAADGLPDAEQELSGRFTRLAAELSSSEDQVAIDGLGAISVRAALAALRRVVLVDSAAGANPLALRYAAPEDFQVSHVGLGPDHATPTIYLSREFAKNAGAEQLRAVLVNDLLELGALSAARSAGLAWTAELARTVLDRAGDHVRRRYGKVANYARALVRGLRRDFEDLGIPPDAVEQAYLSEDAREQQEILNRLAALRAKGFSAEQLTPQLLLRQKSLDLLLFPPGGTPHPSTIGSLKTFREKSPAEFAMLAGGLDLSRVLEGTPSVHPLSPEGHSSVKGLALRLHLTLKRGGDIRPLLDGVSGDPETLRSPWKSWDSPERVSMIPAAERLANVRTTLAQGLADVRAEALPEQANFEKEKRRVENLIRRQPLVETWDEIHDQQLGTAQSMRAQLKALPHVRGKSPEMEALREAKGELREAAKGLSAQAENAKARAAVFTERAEIMTRISLAVREWFRDVKGLSVSGDFLWDKDGERLEMMLIVAGADSPRPLRREVLREIAGLKGVEGLEVVGWQVGEQWLRQAYADVDRNVLVSRFAILGLSLFGPNLANFFGKLPERELWGAALSELEQSEEQNEEGRPAGAQVHARLAVSLAVALGLKLHGAAVAEKLPAWRRLLDKDQEISERLGRPGTPQYLGEWLAEQNASIRETLELLREQGKRSDLERRLSGRLEGLQRNARPGQVGGLLLGLASARAGDSSRKNIYELTPTEARAWLDQAAGSGAAVEKVQERVTALLEQVQGHSRFWEWYPDQLKVGAFVRVGTTAFGRPVELRVRVRERAEDPETVGLLVEAAPGRDGLVADRYDLFLNGALFSLEPDAAQTALRALIRQLELSMGGVRLDEARVKATAELNEKRARDDATDREVLDAALSAYRQGVRVEELPEAEAGTLAAKDWRSRGRARAEELLRLAQGAANFLKSPQRKSGRVLIAYAEEGRREAALRMAEVFAGNDIKVDVVSEPAVPGALGHALREGSYRLGFLLTADGVLPFGHFRGELPEEELTEIIAAETAVKRVRRLAAGAARLAGRIGDRHEVQRAYVASLRERFATEAIRRSSVELLVDTDQGEVGMLFKALGLQNQAKLVDASGNEEALRSLVQSAERGRRRLGVSFGRDGRRMEVLDLDGRRMRPSDLSLIFSWYLVERRGHRGRLFRPFTQTRLIDRLAQRHGLPVEEVDPTIWGVAEADSITLSPWTPYNDRLAQALLAAEIVAETGQSLSALLDGIRRDLGAPLHYEKAAVALAGPSAELAAERLSADGLKDFLAKFMKWDAKDFTTRKSVRGIQVLRIAESGAQDWMYLRWTAAGFELYGESADAGRAAKLLSGGAAYIRKLVSDAGPSKEVRGSLIVMTGVVVLLAGMVLLPLIDPATALQMPVVGWIYQLVGRMVELGFGALEWLFPNFLRNVIPSWNNPWVMSLSVLMFLEFFWYWGTRAIIFSSSRFRRQSAGPLAREIERLPVLPKNPQAEAMDWFTVAPLKDGHLAVLKPAFSRIPAWLQPLLFAYQAQTLIKKQEYDDRNSLFRNGMNARAWLFFAVLFLEPRIIGATFLSLLTAAFPGIKISRKFLRRSTTALAGAALLAGHLFGFPAMLLAVAWGIFLWTGGNQLYGRWAERGDSPAEPDIMTRGLPTHLAPVVGAPLPAELRARYRTEFVLVKRVSDGDTVETFDGRWIRYKGMDASDAKGTKPYKEAKDFNIKMVRGKPVMLLIPQAKNGDHLEDEYEYHNRLLAYAYVQDESGRWVNMSKLMLDKGLATTAKGAPDPMVPFYLEVSAPVAAKRSALQGEAEESSTAVPGMAAGRLVPGRRARAWLKEKAAAAVDERAELALDKDFAGEDGERLAERLGAGLELGAHSQFFVGGAGVRIGGDLRLADGARLNLVAVGAGEDGGRITIGKEVRVEGRLRAIVPPGSALHIIGRTVLTGEHELSVPPGREISIRTAADGSLSIQTEYRHPRSLLRALWRGLKKGTPLEELLGWIRPNRVSAGGLSGLWRRRTDRNYDYVSMPPSFAQVAKSVTKLDGRPLDGKHPDLVARTVKAKQMWLRRSSAAEQRYLRRRQGLKFLPKQMLHVGLERHYKILVDRQNDKIKRMVEDSRLEEWLERRTELNKQERDRFLRSLLFAAGPVGPVTNAAVKKEKAALEGEAAPKAKKGETEKSWEDFARLLPQTAQAALARIREEVARREEILARAAEEERFYVDRAKENLSRLAGLLLLGPKRFPDALSVVIGGSYLFSPSPKALEILVVRPGAAGPRLEPPEAAAGLALPELERLSIVTVGEDWLSKNTGEGERNRLLARTIVTGLTVWGKDIGAVRPQNIGGKVKPASHLALAAELLAESAEKADAPAAEAEAKELSLLAHLVLLTVAGGLSERIPEDDSLSAKQALHKVRLQLERAARHWRGEELRRIVGRATDNGALAPQRDPGMGGVFLLDARSDENGRKPLFETSSEEAWAWIERMSGPEQNRLDGAQRKLTTALERLLSRGEWMTWRPEKLEVDRFVVVGRDANGRAAEVRVRVARSAENPGALAVLAKSKEGRKVSDVDRYELFLNAAIFEMGPEAQGLVLDAAIRQLELAMNGLSLRSARDAISQELGLAGEIGGKDAGQTLLAALAEHARGVRVEEVPFTPAIPWEASIWEGRVGRGEAMRLAQGLAEFLRRPAAPKARSVLIGWADEALRPAAEAAAEVLSGNGIAVEFLAEPAPLDSAHARALRAGGSELGLWIGTEETRVLGKSGALLEPAATNELGGRILQAQHARLLPRKLAQEQGLLHDAAAPPPAEIDPAPGAAEPAAAPQRPAASSGLSLAFFVHSLIVGAALALLFGSIFFPAAFVSLPIVSSLFTAVRAMMMFKSMVLLGSPWIIGLMLITAIALARYFAYGRILYGMAQGKGRYRGLVSELDPLPRVMRPSTRSKGWSPVEALPDGRIGIREEGFARKSPLAQLLIYTYSAAHTRFMEHPVMRFLINMAHKMVIGRFKVARVTFFVLTEPFLMLYEWSLLSANVLRWAAGKPIRFDYRIMPSSAQGMAVLPKSVRDHFDAEWAMITSVVSEDDVMLEDGRTVRVIGAGATGNGISLATTEARSLLQGKEVLLLTDKNQQDTRRVPAHLYVVETGTDGGRRLIHGLKSLMARHPAKYGTRLPNTLLVDDAKLRLGFRLQETPEIDEEDKTPARWEKIFAGSVLAALGALAVAFFTLLLAGGLSPVATGLAWVFLAALGLPAAYGILRLWRGEPKGFVMKHKFIAAALAVSLAALAGGLVSGGPGGPAAKQLNNASLAVMEGLRILPRSASLGYDGGGAETWPAVAAPLAADHFLAEQARVLLGRASPVSTWVRVELPAELAAKYDGIWAYSSHVVDGDTFYLSNGRGVRVVGVNTPETDHGPGFKAKEAAQEFGPEAHEFAAKHLDKKKVLLLIPKDRPTDSYGRVLANVYAQNATGEWEYFNALLLEAGFGNDRYGAPDPILRGKKGPDGSYQGPYRKLDAAAFAAKAPATVEVPAQRRALAMNQNETRSYVEEGVRFEGWIDAQTLKVVDSKGKSQSVRLFASDIPAAKQAEAFKVLAELPLKPGDKIFLYKAKHYDEPGVPFQLTQDGKLKAYVYFADAKDPQTYRNLNRILVDEKLGLSRLTEGRPDAVMHETARLNADTMDYAQAAWIAAGAPLDPILGVDGRADLRAAYWHALNSKDAAAARPLAAGASLLAHYSRMGIVKNADRAELFAALLRAETPADHDRWVLESLLPRLRDALAEQNLPVPAGRASWSAADWREVLLHASAGKLGAAPDRLHFPAEAQAGQMSRFLAEQGLAEAGPAATAEGVVYARMYLKMPADLRVLVPKRWIGWSAGAFWAPTEASQLHRYLLYEHLLSKVDKYTPMSPSLMAMAYSYPESVELLFSDSRGVVGMTSELAQEALKEAGLARVVHGHLAGLVSEPRRAELLKLLSEGQVAAAERLLTPAETFMLGRKLVDDPALHRYLLKSHQDIRAKAGRLVLMGMDRQDFLREFDALLALPGGGSVSERPLKPFEAVGSRELELQRRVFAELLVQTILGMEKEGIPARFLPQLLPKAAQLVLKDGSRSGPGDWAGLSAAARKITPGLIHGWMFEAMSAGVVTGPALDAALLSRGDLDALLARDFRAAQKVERYDNKEVVGSVGFPSYFAGDLKTFKHGTFRVDPKNESGYSHWKKGELIKIMVGKGESRQGLFNTRIVAIEYKALGQMTLEELKSEFPPTRFLKPWVSDETLRQELIDELIGGLKRFYPHVDRDTKGYMIRFESYPEVQHKN